MQLFVGVWPPPRVQKLLSDYPRPNRNGVRWSTPSQWLVKLRPLGHVADRVVPDSDLRVGGEGHPIEGRPRLSGCGDHSAEQLSSLHWRDRRRYSTFSRRTFWGDAASSSSVAMNLAKVLSKSAGLRARLVGLA